MDGVRRSHDYKVELKMNRFFGKVVLSWHLLKPDCLVRIESNVLVILKT